jgi:RND family efflux transporter MFP subunit
MAMNPLLPTLICLTFPFVTIDTNVTDEAGETLVIQDVQAVLIRDVQVPVTLSGQVEQFHVREGDRVTAGQPLANLHATLAQRAVQLAEHELRIAELESRSDSRLRLTAQRDELVKERLARLLDLQKRSASSISMDDVHEAMLQEKESDSDYQLAKEQHEIAKLNRLIKAETLEVNSERLARHTIRAPFDGYVVELISKEGEWLAEGAAVLRLIDLRRIRLEAFVDGQLYDETLNGSPVTFLAHVPNRAEPVAFHGTVVFTNPMVQPVNGQVRLWAEVDNPEFLLRPGVLGTLTIQTKAAENQAVQGETVE